MTMLSLPTSERDARTLFEIYEDAPSSRSWRPPKEDGETVVVSRRPAHQADDAAGPKSESERVMRSTHSISMEQIDALIARIRGRDRDLGARELEPAVRISAGLATNGRVRTALQSDLDNAGLRAAVVRSALFESTKRLEQAMTTAAIGDWMSAATSMAESLGHSLDALAADAGELWPGSRWRFHRLHAVEFRLRAIDASLDQMRDLLVFRGFDFDRPNAWFACVNRCVHTVLAEIGNSDDDA